MTTTLERSESQTSLPDATLAVPSKPTAAPAAVGGPVRWQWDAGLVLRMVAMVLLGLLLNLVFVSQLQHFTSQTDLYGKLRLSLAEGSAPVGQTDVNGQLVTPGTPLALMEIPQLNMSEVIVEGTASPQTAVGIGHRRDTVLPGQPGASVLMGRSGAYGGTLAGIGQIAVGEKFVVTTGQGKFTYEVLGIRNPGDPVPPPLSKGEGRLTLMTAGGSAFMPTDVLRLDAKLVSEPAAKPAAVIRPGSLPASEQALGQDTSGLFGMIMLLQLLTAAAIAAVWCWKKWGKWETWIVMAPVLLTLGILTGSQVNMLLPNLL